MDTQKFLSRVLATEDTYVLYVWKDDKASWNENYASLEEMCQAILEQDKTPNTIYYAIGKFANNVELSPKSHRPIARRRKEHATRFKTLCCDIDVGDKHVFKTQGEGAKALIAACDKLGLAHPILVSSGRGVHAYWPLTASINAEIWEKLSRALRAALHAHGVDIDTTKIHDRSMVLRPPGAHHKKDPDNWREVKVVRDGPDNDPMALAEKLAPFKSAAALSSGRPRKAKSEMISAVLDTFQPINIDNLRKCQQMKAVIESGGAFDITGAQVSYALWLASQSFAKFSTNPEEALQLLCGNHPDFDLEANLRKMNTLTGSGPYSCAKVKEGCESGCNGCKYEGKITTPAQLTDGITEITVPDPISGTDIDIVLPRGYAIKNNAIVFRPPGADSDEDDKFVAPYLMYVVARFSDVEENKQVAKVAVQFPIEGLKVIDVDVASIATGGSELNKALALKQVYTTGDNRLLRQYLMTYLQQLQKASAIEFYYKHYGWQNDGSFLAGGGLVGKQTSGQTHYDGPIEQYRDFMQPQGDLLRWVEGTKFFAHPELKFHGLGFLMMAGAPLLKGSGLASLLVNFYSKESGSGKTLTASFGLSIWGKPSMLKRTVNDTDNALYKHCGIMNSLGAYIDEITTMEAERLRNFVFTLQEGRERDRVRQSADGFREKVYWNMPVFASSNRDAYEALSVRYSSEAEKLRLLQLPFDRVSLFEKGNNLGYKISKFLDENHGLAGPVLVQAIMDRGGYAEVYDRAYKRFSDRYQFTFTGPERFYQAAFVTADAIGEIMHEIGLLRFDYQDAVRRGLYYVEALRTEVVAAEMNALDLVFQFMTENANKIVHYREMKTKHDTKQFILDPIPQTAVGRTEVQYDENNVMMGGFMFLNRGLFKQWCQKNGADYRAVMTGLYKDGVLVQDNYRKTLYKGVPGSSATGQTYCTRIDLASHPRFIEANSEMGDSPMEITPRIAAVS